MTQLKDRHFKNSKDVSIFCQINDVKVVSICFDNNSNEFVLFYTENVEIPPRPRPVFPC